MSTQISKNTVTFPLKKSPSMELAASPQPAFVTAGIKHLPSGFPTSPQSTFGEEILHFSHRHPLFSVNLPEPFMCSGCKDPGAGKRFSCQQCDFQLHDFCASAPQALNCHPFHAQHQLLFQTKPKPGGILSPACDVCGKPITGFTFRCNACSFQMHPCCAKLSAERKFPVHQHSLSLLPAMTTLSNDDPAGFTCGECKRKRSGRVYRCTACDYHLHAVCAKDMVNGFHANGIKPSRRPNRFRGAVRLASNVFIGFLGGIIEGFGEGIGDALIQSVTKGRCNSNRRIME